MGTSLSFASKLFRTFAEHFSAAGYEKRRVSLYTRILHEDALGWVGLNKALREDAILINPVIGVRHQHLEAVIADLQGLARHDFIPPSVSSPLGYLTPRKTFINWDFEVDTNPERLSKEMVTAIVDYGEPFMQRYSDLSEIETLEQAAAEPAPTQTDYRVAVSMALRGRHQQAKTFITGRLQTLGTRNDAAANHFRLFVERFLNYDFR